MPVVTTDTSSPASQYETLFRSWLDTSEAPSVSAARALGESLLAAEIGLAELVLIHQTTLDQILTERPEQAVAIVRSGSALQLECLKPYAAALGEHHPAADALRHLNQRLEEKVKRIAHALHDEAGQLLASVYLNVAEIASELPHRGRRRLEELRALLDRVDDELRRLAHELRPTVLDDLGLLPACQFLAEGVSHRSGVRVTVHGDTGGRLPADAETALYRVVQEALTNAARHGQAHSVTVSFTRSGSTLRGSIRDDGVGFDAAAVLTQRNNQGLGLMGMRERVVAVGGTLTITSQPGSGTSIQFEVPTES